MKGNAMATMIGTSGSSSACGAWDLDENETRALPRGRVGSVVRVQRGTVLVTQEGDGEDHVLEPGDELLLRRRGRAVAWAFTDATISVCASTAAGRTIADRDHRSPEAA
jgi:Protein of unknown function (DUF2917)